MIATQQKSRRMATPEELRKFAVSFEAVRERIEAAKLYIQYEDDCALAAQGMRRTCQAALECGKLLKEMKESAAYRDVHRNWAACCRALGISRSHSYRLMDDCARLGKPAATAPLKMAGPTLHEQDEEDPDNEHEPAADTIPFSGLRETLRASAEGSDGKIKDGDDKPAKPRDATWVERHMLVLERWFDGREEATAAQPHINALVELAREAA